MDRTGVPYGDGIASAKTSEPKGRQIVGTRLGDEVTLKQFTPIDKRHVELPPEYNPAHKVAKLDPAKQIRQIEGLLIGAATKRAPI